MRKNKGHIIIAGAIIFSSLLICTVIFYTNIKPPFYHCYHNIYKAALVEGENKYKTKPLEYIKKYENITNIKLIIYSIQYQLNLETD